MTALSRSNKKENILTISFYSQCQGSRKKTRLVLSIAGHFGTFLGDPTPIFSCAPNSTNAYIKNNSNWTEGRMLCFQQF